MKQKRATSKRPFFDQLLTILLLTLHRRVLNAQLLQVSAILAFVIVKRLQLWTEFILNFGIQMSCRLLIVSNHGLVLSVHHLHVAVVVPGLRYQLWLQ